LREKESIKNKTEKEPEGIAFKRFVKKNVEDCLNDALKRIKENYDTIKNSKETT
jgi:hypothetical protein